MPALGAEHHCCLLQQSTTLSCPTLASTHKKFTEFGARFHEPPLPLCNAEIIRIFQRHFASIRLRHTHVHQSCLGIRWAGFDLVGQRIFQPYSGFVSSGCEPCYWLCFPPSSPFQGHSFKETRWLLKTRGAEAGQFYLYSKNTEFYLWSVQSILKDSLNALIFIATCLQSLQKYFDALQRGLCGPKPTLQILAVIQEPCKSSLYPV